MPILKRIRVIKKIQEDGAWRFVSLKRAGKRGVWDPRPGTYYLEWWDGGARSAEPPSAASWPKTIVIQAALGRFAGRTRLTCRRWFFPPLRL
jgi:hypothetical protein